MKKIGSLLGDNLSQEEVEAWVAEGVGEGVSDDAVSLERERWRRLSREEVDECYVQLVEYMERGDPRLAPLWNGLALWEGGEEAVRVEVARRQEGKYGGRNTIYKVAPYRVSELFLRKCWMEGEVRTLWFYKGEFWAWRAGVYVALSLDEVKGKLYVFLAEHCRTHNDEAVNPDRAFVGKVLDPLRGLCELSADFVMPCWLDGRVGPRPEDVVAFRNGLLDVRTRVLMEHTPSFFTPNRRDFDYEPDAPRPARWERFLEEVWPEDRESVDTVHEMMGYCLTPDTRQQKGFEIIGLSRSGKGTVAKVAKELAGEDNVSGPTLTALGTQFGLERLIGKQVAIVPDARVSNRTDKAPIVEALLAITGEDKLSIDRKNKGAWEGKLDTRIIILSNKVPELADSGGVLPSRFIVLAMGVSFLGREDIHLFDRLKGEVPGIMNLALDGLDRLRERGRFVQPASGRAKLRELEEEASPAAAFARDRLRVAVNGMADSEKLWCVWKEWCEEADREVGTKEKLGRELRKVLPGIRKARPRVGGERPWHYKGIELEG